MDALAWTITLRLTEDRVLLPGSAERRTWARVVLEQAREAGLLAFHGPDTHGHLLLACPRPLAGQVVREIEAALQAHLDLPVPFERARIRPVDDVWHLQNSLHYVLGQLARHGLRQDPAQEASNLPDLLGLRPLGAWTASNVRRHLPRVDRASLLEHLGADPEAPPPAPPDLDTWLEAARSAACVEDLASKRPEAVRARTALVQLVEAPTATLAEALGLHRRTIRRLRATPADAALSRAIGLQAALRAQEGHDELFLSA